MAATLGQLAASVTSAFAPESRSRCSSASPAKSTNSGTEISPAFHAATWAKAVSGACASSTATRSPATRPSPPSALASRFDARETSPKVRRSIPPSSRSTISASASALRRSVTSAPRL